jgi:hypothetical protein
MPEYQQTGTIMAEPDVLFDYLAEVEHLPEYLPVITEAEPAGPELAVVTTDIHGDEQHAEGWLRVDGLERRMEWGTSEGPYHGWLQVEPDDESGGSVVTIHVWQDHVSDADDDLVEALDNIRQLVESGEI